MLPDLSQAISSLDVTITPTMLVLTGVVTYMIQFLKACVSTWVWLTDEREKAMWPLVGIGLCSLAFGFAGVENFLVAGGILGLAAGGGYDQFKATSGLIKPKLPNSAVQSFLNSIDTELQKGKSVPPETGSSVPTGKPWTV